ncbi:MAG: SIMPL domain-containing protein [Candidatus Andersenbacteria bacterium]
MSTKTSSYPLHHPVIFAALIGGLLYIGGQFVATEPLRQQQVIDANRQIDVQGTGKITAAPTIAKVTLGVNIEPQTTAEAATQQLADQLEAVMAALAQLGIAQEDIQTTGISTQPAYDFTDGSQRLRGYTASEQIEVTVRNTDRAGAIVSRATEAGANQVGNIQFTFEDDADLIAQAEAEAIKDAKQRAERLAKELGVQIGAVKTFSSSTQGKVPPYLPFAADARGGAESLPISPGTEDTVVIVNITYQLR